jgi:hypothetical protein
MIVLRIDNWIMEFLQQKSVNKGQLSRHTSCQTFDFALGESDFRRSFQLRILACLHGILATENKRESTTTNSPQTLANAKHENLEFTPG